jgi:4-amino-4-deoxy-L-arabinose transferase-like glycosyltransferase
MNLNKWTAASTVQNRLPVIVFWAAALFLLFWGLGDKNLIGSSYRWAEVTREMLLTGDFFHPAINGEPYFDKPLLGYWFIALVSRVTGGLNEWAVNLPSAVAGFLALWATVWLGRKLWSEQAGRTAGWIMLTTYGFLMWGRRGEADIANLAAIILAVAWYWARRDKPSFGAYLVFYLICFIGAHTKGLAAVAIPLIVLLPDIIREHRWRAHLTLSHFIALLICLAIYLAPFIYASQSNPDYQSSGLYLVFKENIQRFINPFDHVEPFYVYLIYVPQLFLPWTPLLLVALAGLISSVKNLEYNTRWLLEGIILIFLFFTVSGSRRVYYILPILPFCALATAVFFLNDGRHGWKQLGYRIQQGLFGLALIVAVFTPAMGPLIKKITGLVLPKDLIIGTPLLGLAGLLVWLLNRYRPRLLSTISGIHSRMAPLIAIAVIFMGGFFTWQYISLDVYDTKSAFALELKELVAGVAAKDIAFYRRGSTQLIFNADLPVPIKVFAYPEAVRNFLKSNRATSVVIFSNKDRDDFIKALPPEIREKPTISEKIYPFEKNSHSKLMAWKVKRQNK